MPEANPLKTLSFSKPSELALWLEQHHETESELWVKIFKKNSHIPSVTWNDVVIEILCWGWIDGIKKSVDEEAYLQRITPRKAKSSWSKRNCEHVEKLIKNGRMQQAGLVHVESAKADGRWANAYTASEIEVPKDFLDALSNKPKEKAFFETLTKTSRYVIAYGLTSTKREETRKKRFDKYMQLLTDNIKPN
jgi:uncharacterized protein YdeI (YjbR/CyaY-like superfamily)